MQSGQKCLELHGISEWQAGDGIADRLISRPSNITGSEDISPK